MRSALGKPLWQTGKGVGYMDSWCPSIEKEGLKKLAAYEDTGLTPEEIKEDMPNVRLIEEKLARYEDAEADGRLIVLPCKVGDVLWQRGAAKGTIGRFEAPDVHWIIEHIKEFGKTVFLSREEAEAALAKEW